MLIIYRSIVNASILSAAAFISLSISYSILANGFHQTYPIATLYRMHNYHNGQPLQYIAIIAVVFGAFGALWIKYFGQSRGRRKWLTMTMVIVLTIVGSSPIGGILWHIHDMQHGFIPAGAKIWGKLIDGIIGGLLIGWIIVLLSIPLNLIGVVSGYSLLHSLSKSSRNRK
jgi:H+/Cl- antiporter ClcA